MNASNFFIFKSVLLLKDIPPTLQHDDDVHECNHWKYGCAYVYE